MSNFVFFPLSSYVQEWDHAVNQCELWKILVTEGVLFCSRVVPTLQAHCCCHMW